jgi:hypothetical protein
VNQDELWFKISTYSTRLPPYSHNRREHYSHQSRPHCLSHLIHNYLDHHALLSWEWSLPTLPQLLYPNHAHAHLASACHPPHSPLETVHPMHKVGIVDTETDAYATADDEGRAK